MVTAFYSVLVFFLLMAVLRIMGKRELSQLSAFDLVVLFVIGDLVAEAVISEDTSFFGAVIAISTFTLLTVLVSWVAFRFPRLQPALDGTPTVIVRDGSPDDGAMKRERITLFDLREAARNEGIRDIADIELALLEPDGSFSFFTRQDR
ncbi:DUF421 domain-containing protein [Nocardioides jishulii]|uniref:DUF421 domain-containing protein n=1 Tax=Nocardioides jishulii TaxID=2575440 RepID=A0A4U2YN02_9ACTN|nr:YetF domain-containing protein [Nocardioides jishulii]QCX27543.1 DUF421 domain-containing protein [Nocardioides jishulii]TKI62350.1 DUF421 domain-containing protein [Nocardioides jishulii]